MEVLRTCDPEGPGIRGLVTTNQLRRRVKRGWYAIAAMKAPPGTTFSSVRWAGKLIRASCRYALDLWTRRSARVCR
jgi:hypothetical protein